jgi:hypothetical protein
MTKNDFKATNKQNLLGQIVLLICCILLSACSSISDSIFFLGFPIAGITEEYGEHFPLSETQRRIFSIVWYALCLSVVVILPLFLTKCFKNTTLYLVYKKFWFVGSLLLPMLFTMLTGLIPANWYLFDNSGINGEIVIYCIFMAISWKIVWYLMVLPASIQHNKYANK